MLYSSVRKLNRRTFEVSDQLPALFGQLCGIAFIENDDTLMTRRIRGLLWSYRPTPFSQIIDFVNL